MSRSAERIYDEYLVLGCQAGDEEAFAELARRWHPRLVRRAVALLGNLADAEDAAQEALMAIARSIRGLEDPTRFASWAFRILARRASDQVREACSRRRTDGAAEAPPPPAPEGHDEVRSAVERLPGEYRSVLELFYRVELEVAEIAEVLGIPEGTVKSRLHEGRARVRQALERSRT